MKCRGQGYPHSSITNAGDDFKDDCHLESMLPLTAFDLGAGARCQEICHKVALAATAHDQHMQLTAIQLCRCITIDTILITGTHGHRASLPPSSPIDIQRPCSAPLKLRQSVIDY